MTMIRTLLALCALLLLTPGLAHADLVTTLNPRDAITTVYPGYAPSPYSNTERNFDWRFSSFNGVTLSGQTISSTFLFSRDRVAHLDLQQRHSTDIYEGKTYDIYSGGMFAFGIALQTNSPIVTLPGTPSNFVGRFPGFATPLGASLLTVGSLAWPDLRADQVGGGMSSDGSFGLGFSFIHPRMTSDPTVDATWPESSVDVRGVRFNFTLPDTGYAITGGSFYLALQEPSSVRFVSVPEHAILPRLPKILPRLMGLGVERRVTSLMQKITTVLVATLFWAPYSGTEIYLDRITLNVAEACAGYHTLLLALLVGGLLLSVRRQQTIGGGLAILAVAIAVGFAANAFRAAGIAVFLDHFGSSTETQIHYGKEWIQYVVTAVALTPLLWAGRLTAPRRALGCQ